VKALYCELQVTMGVTIYVPDDFDTNDEMKILKVAKKELQAHYEHYEHYENGSFEMNLLEDSTVKLLSCEKE